jgi:hypothetical protein
MAGLPSQAEVTAQMAKESGTGQNTYLPARQLAAWMKAGTIPNIPVEQDQTQLLRMYMALKNIMGGKGGRISASQFSGYVRTITHSTSFKRKLWVVPMANFDSLDREALSKFIIDKATVTEFPTFADPMDIELVDQCVPQSSLGMGVQEFEVKISDTKASSEPGNPALAANPKAAPFIPTVFASSGSGSGSASVPQPAIRTLKREESISDQDAAEQIACDTKIAFEKGELSGGDKRSSNSVEFWMQSMLSHIQSLKRKYTGELDFVSQLDTYASMYWKFVCTRMLYLEDWSQAQPLGSILNVVQKEFGMLLSPLGLAVVVLLTGGGHDGVNFPDMALATRAEFFRTNDGCRLHLVFMLLCDTQMQQHYFIDH